MLFPVVSAPYRSSSTRHGVARTWVHRVTVLFCAVAALLYGSQADAQCLKCTAATDQSSCSVSDAWGFCCVPGFVVADDNADGSASVSMTIGQNSLELLQTFNSDGCCVAPYANIGIFDACQASDQYGQAGSHLPLQLKDIAQLKGAWTFQVPMPLNPDYTVEQYRVYYEMFLSTTAAGSTDGGNITIDFFWNNYGFDPATVHAPLNGSQGMDYFDYGGQVGQGQGPFVDFLYPKGTYSPDSNGVVTVTSTVVKAVLDWAVANFPNYYTGNLYLSSLSLAEEAGAFHGTVKTTYASFAIQKSGSDVVYTPPWTSSHWSGLSAGGNGTNLSTTGGASAAGAGPNSSAGTGTSSGSHSDSSGCGCKVPTRGVEKSAAAWFGLGLMGLAFLRRRC